MKTTFLISDTHFGHQRMYEFEGAHGNRVRSAFSNSDEGDEAMVDNWNRVVKPTDKVYHLGDVFINRKARGILERLNGDKVLIKGNHDIFSLDHYLPYFRDIRACHKLNDILLSHVPVHTSQLMRFKTNVHGHLHENRVLDQNGNIDTRYINVCVEHINYTPIALDDVIKMVSNAE